MKNGFAVAGMMLLAAGALMAQDIVVPSFYETIFTAAMMKAIAAIIGFVQLVKNMTGLKGYAAVGLAVFVSLGYAFTVYLDQGIAFCLLVGLAAAVPAALAYWATRKVGKAVAKTE
jgi:hypothetical protein